MGPLAIVLLAWCALRLAELLLSVVDTSDLLDRGAREACRGQHLPLLLANLAVPTSTFLGVAVAALRVETAVGVRVAALAVLVVAECLHWWAIATLGRRWTTGVLVLPGEVPETRGPYRWLRHPGYVAGSLSAVALPVVVGAWPVALPVAVTFALVVRRRIRCEDRAWREIGGAPPP